MLSKRTRGTTKKSLIFFRQTGSLAHCQESVYKEIPVKTQAREPTNPEKPVSGAGAPPPSDLSYVNSEKTKCNSAYVRVKLFRKPIMAKM